MSGDPEIQRLVNQIDQDVRLGLLKMPPFPETTTAPDDTNVSFFLFHPLLAIRVKMKQIMVGLDHELSPHTSTIEGFPNLPLYQAYIAMVRGGQLPPPSIDWHYDDPLGINKASQTRRHTGAPQRIIPLTGCVETHQPSGPGLTSIEIRETRQTLSSFNQLNRVLGHHCRLWRIRNPIHLFGGNTRLLR